MRLTFVIKGENTTDNLKVIDKQLDKRGIVCRLLSAGTDFSVFETYPRNLERLAEWHAETPKLIPGFGYPVGTCLIYSLHHDQECRLLD